MQAREKVLLINALLEENFVLANNLLDKFNPRKQQLKEKFVPNKDTVIFKGIHLLAGLNPSNLVYTEISSIRDDINYLASYMLEDTAREVQGIKFNPDKVEEMDTNPTLPEFLLWKLQNSQDSTKQETILSCLKKINEYIDVWNDICDNLKDRLDARLSSTLRPNPVELIVIPDLQPKQNGFTATPSNYTPATFRPSSSSSTPTSSSSSTESTDKNSKGSSEGQHPTQQRPVFNEKRF